MCDPDQDWFGPWTPSNLQPTWQAQPTFADSLLRVEPDKGEKVRKRRVAVLVDNGK
jgi:hypothetical protein